MSAFETHGWEDQSGVVDVGDRVGGDGGWEGGGDARGEEDAGEDGLGEDEEEARDREHYLAVYVGAEDEDGGEVRDDGHH